MDALDHLILFADLVGSTDVACELPIQAYAKTYIGSYHWAACKAYSLLTKAGQLFDETNSAFKTSILRDEWRIVGDQLTAITQLNGRSPEDLESLVACACAFAYNLKLYWLLSPYNLCRLQNRQFPRDLAVGIHIGPLATVSKSERSAVGLHLSVTKRIESEARTGIESRIFASPDIVHLFNAWTTRVNWRQFKMAPPISSTVFRRLEKSVEAKGIPKPLRVSELEWNKQVLDNMKFWNQMIDSGRDIPQNVWDNTADAVAEVFLDGRNDDFLLEQEKVESQGNYGSELVALLLEKPEEYIQKWFTAIQSRPKIFADEAWLVLNTLFITVSFYRNANKKRLNEVSGLTAEVMTSYNKTANQLLDDWKALRKSERARQSDCPLFDRARRAKRK